MVRLSFLIPARNEEFLVKTIDDILSHTGDESEVIVGLDGYWPSTPIADNPRVKIFHVTESIGQRAMQNQLARLSRAKYVCKVDAHCSFDEDFGNKMLKFFEEVGDDMVAAPIMRNLHAFDWVCPDGHRRYQGPSGACQECGKPTEKEIMWIGKLRPESTTYCFDNEPHFQYFNEYKRRPEYKEMREKFGYTETMSLQGSFFMSTRHNYWKYELCDERAGSWGNQGLEIACAAWLSGLRVLVNHNTWYSHMFRTQGGDFSFPYQNSGRDVKKTKEYIKEKYLNKQHKRQVHSVRWLVEKFWPVNGWTTEDLEKLDG
jgi:hypothetical protein